MEEVAKYPDEVLASDDDDGTMVKSKEDLAAAVIGHKIIGVERDIKTTNQYGWGARGTRLTLDNGDRVMLLEEGDCCAYTEVQDIVMNLDNVDHVITGVGTTDGYTTWHIYADLGDIMTMKVGWSCGNPFYYGYGFDIKVVDENGRPKVHSDEPAGQ